MKIKISNTVSASRDFLNRNHTLNLNPSCPGEIKSKIRIKRDELAFSLLEVMIAIAIFFMASFVILALVSSGLKTARMLRNDRPNAGILAAEMTLTNTLEEGIETGDFGDLYRDYTWRREVYAADTTGMVSVAFFIYKRGTSAPDSAMEIHRYDPGMKTKRLGLQP